MQQNSRILSSSLWMRKSSLGLASLRLFLRLDMRLSSQEKKLSTSSLLNKGMASMTTTFKDGSQV